MKAYKEKLKVIIFTEHHKIKGEVHLYENSRLTDILNADTMTKDFLPITNAILQDLRRNEVQEVGFLSINRRHIEIVMEDDEAIALSRANELVGKRKFTDALQYAQRAVKAMPDNPAAYYTLGFCLAKTGNISEAKKIFEKCLKLNPDTEIKRLTEEIIVTIK